MTKLSDNARAKVESPNFGYLATVMPDGSPQVSPVWVDIDGDAVLVNTASGRVKERNMRRDPRVAISIADKDNQYEKVDIRGRVAEWVEGDEAVQHIHKMAKKYMGQDEYPWLQPGEQRVVAKIEPEAVSEMG
ncbi:MAG TPA: PPOX class F420-dependent oxidoreductase [Gaiellaceae bacterium]|nr:PPOX class F420-dependent oxidoreductase [Gaiellaceae bacterium]